VTRSDLPVFVVVADNLLRFAASVHRRRDPIVIVS